MILGLTGGIGSGKSTASKIFISMGIKVFDADVIAKKILETDIIKNEIKERLGKKFIDINKNNLNKELLKKEVFHDKKKLEILNEIIHPKVIEKYKKLYFEYKETNEIIVFDVPLLFEVNLEKYCNKVLVIDIDPEIQMNRIKARDGIDIELIKKIIEAQMPREEKIKKGDIIINNNGKIEELEEKIRKVIKDLERGKI
ncbi:dephospho-CoA kinase [Candidatus Cetobacterium colombiensis]|uniref:Dephospho-CoA kinase n=1 Tax=Candidatus Cetobacterium colombiensis TaxID=3073100 RepID=A0ABU4WAH7_9FUSO|nr:dephospho-CoA kinase [Candidatus Cetobacterium colombiensis]MDX8336526.1 dephospho-CoA kinase [Candidatus Cetobacterium colombiensis]